jgi:hypothetical protein
MQPYFFPYLGYFQLMHAVDVFVVYDDAQYMKGGWINRNRILVNDKEGWLTLPTRKASVVLPINQRAYLQSEWVDSIKGKLLAAYKKAPMFDVTFPFICDLLDFSDPNVAAFNTNLLIALANKLGITCSFISSSDLAKRADLTGQGRVIDICHLVHADHYINTIGGTHLYSKKAFEDEGIKLSFLEHNQTSYRQFLAAPVPSLSIIDVLMFNSVNHAQPMLDDHSLVPPPKDPVH